MRNKIVLFITGAITLLLSSCLGTESNYDYEMPKNAQISGFSMKNDSVAKLDKVKFTIDQLDGRIFNLDSLPYGTKIEKVVCTINMAVSGTPLQIIQEAVGDTIWWNGTDSLDFSKPVKFIAHAYDGVNTKTYQAQVNIHQVVPDSMAWSLYANKLINTAAKEQKVIAFGGENNPLYYMYIKPASGKGYQLYRSLATDAKNWTEVTLTGLPAEGLKLAQITDYAGILYIPTDKGAVYQSVNGRDWALQGNAPAVKALLGIVKEGGANKQPSVLAAIVENNGKLNYAAMDTTHQWKTGDEVAANFPVVGFANLNYSAVYREYLMILAGRNKANQLLNSGWATANGTSWALLTDEESIYAKTFEKREGVMLTKYDDKFFMTGGLNASGNGLKDIYLSIDNGVTWTLSDTLVVMPKDYKGRGFGSVIVDKDKFMLIIGGKTNSNSNMQDELWRGRINRLGFKN